MPSVETSIKETPVLVVAAPAPLEEQRERLYTLVYRRGGQVREKNFPFVGKLDQAIARGRDHCRIMGNIRFVIVRPLVVDLEYQEKTKVETGRSPDDENI